MVDDQRPRARTDVAGAQQEPRADGAQSFRAVVTPDSTLRSALDGIVGSLTNVAVVVGDDGEYRGMVRIDEISEGVRD